MLIIKLKCYHIPHHLDIVFFEKLGHIHLLSFLCLRFIFGLVWKGKCRPLPAMLSELTLRPFVLCFFAYPAMPVVTILYCPSSNHSLNILLHLSAQAFTWLIWFSFQYFLIHEDTVGPTCLFLEITASRFECYDPLQPSLGFPNTTRDYPVI
jgi:hypothetical protein